MHRQFSVTHQSLLRHCYFSLINNHFGTKSIMKTFWITVRTPEWAVCYQAIARSSCEAITDAITCFGIAAVSAVPAKIKKRGEYA
jgi:hypothetical protein